MTMLTRPARQEPHNFFRPAGDPRGRHSGEDTGHASGGDVLVAAPGVVVSVYDDDGFNQGWGNRVVIRHAPGVHTTYNHFDAGDRIRVKVGQSVAAGLYLGDMGSTGTSTGDHLHFELEIGGRGPQFRVDPRPYFSKHLPGTAPAVPAPAASLKVFQRVVRNLGRNIWLNGRSKPHINGAWAQKLEGGITADFDGWIRGQRVTIAGVSSDVWFRGRYGKKWFAAAGFTSQSTAGLTDLNPKAAPAKPKPTPKPQVVVFDVPSGGQYFYHRYANALAGNFDPAQLIPGDHADLRVLENPGTGPVKVKYGNLHVWVGTRRNPARVVKR